MQPTERFKALAQSENVRWFYVLNDYGDLELWYIQNWDDNNKRDVDDAIFEEHQNLVKDFAKYVDEDGYVLPYIKFVGWENIDEVVINPFKYSSESKEFEVDLETTSSGNPNRYIPVRECLRLDLNYQWIEADVHDH